MNGRTPPKPDPKVRAAVRQLLTAVDRAVSANKAVERARDSVLRYAKGKGACRG
jgi:hypothetical protein